VFALGVTLHDALTGRSSDERAQACLGLEPLCELIPDVDADLEALVAKAIDPEARWRYRDARELADDLQRWLDGREVAARRPPLVERARRWVRAHPRRVARASLIAVALIVGLLAASGIGRWTAAAGRV